MSLQLLKTKHVNEKFQAHVRYHFLKSVISGPKMWLRKAYVTSNYLHNNDSEGKALRCVTSNALRILWKEMRSLRLMAIWDH